jgi:SnoaL-like domain
MAEPSASKRVLDWKTAWESRDADRVAALFAPGATHSSMMVARIWPELGRGELRGRNEVREYARRGLARFTELRFELLTVTESDDRAAVEYRRHSNVDGANPAHVLELIEWGRELIRAVRVFHA